MLPSVEDQLDDSVQVRARVEAVRDARADDGEDVRRALAADVLPREEPVLASEDEPPELALAVFFAPDVALLDIGLPVMDGYELARRLREQSGGASLRLAAVTGYGQAEDRRRSAAAGFDEHLVKPIDVGALASALDVG